jgi:hypothetical protein
MQKLNRSFTQSARESGSALIGAIALSVILAFAALGFLQISGSISQNESQLLEESKAFYAAESGLQLATRYARTFNQATYSGLAKTSMAIPININGYAVSCTLEIKAGPPRLALTAATTSGIPGAGFRKRVYWDAQSNFTQYAHIYGREHDDNYGIDEAPYKASDPNNWLGHMGAKIWHGPYHMNDKMKLAYKNTGRQWWDDLWNYFRFDGPVTIAAGKLDTFNLNNAASNYHMNYTTNWRNANGGAWPANVNGYQNNFDDGLQLMDAVSGNNHTLTSAANTNLQTLLNSWFLNRFQSNAPQVDLPPNIIAQVTASNTIALPTSQAPTGYTLGDSSINYRPTLEFKGGATPQAIYHYYNGTVYKDSTLSNWNGKALYSPTAVNVHGVVKGQVTVVSAPGTSIAIVTDGKNGTRGNSNLPGLVYDDFYLQNDTFPAVSSGTNVIGLVTGKDILYSASWYKATGTQPLTKIQIRDSLFQYPTPANNYQKTVDKRLFATAAQLATADLNGCARWDLKIPTNTNYYSLMTFGSDAYNRYRQESDGSNGQIGASAYYDTRLANNISFPNQPVLYSIDADNSNNHMLNFTFINWQSSNPL